MLCQAPGASLRQGREPLSCSNLRRRGLKPLLPELGIDESVHLYALRHTHATMLLSAVIHPKIMAERLGHASVRMTLDVYSQVIPTMQREVAGEVGSLLYSRFGTDCPWPWEGRATARKEELCPTSYSSDEGEKRIGQRHDQILEPLAGYAVPGPNCPSRSSSNPLSSELSRSDPEPYPGRGSLSHRRRGSG